MKNFSAGASSLPRQTTLVLAMGAALAGMLPTTVMASASLCVNGGHLFTLSQTWTGGDCSIVSGQGAVTSATFAGYTQLALFGTGSNMGTLTNAGTLVATNARSAASSGFVMAQNTSAARVINDVGGTILGSITGYSTSDSVETIFAAGINNLGSITAVENHGQILGSITNTGNNTQSDPSSISTLNLFAAGIFNSSWGTIATLTNGADGTISGNTDGQTADGNSQVQGVGLYNMGTISTIANAGRIAGEFYGVYNAGGTIGLLFNTGTIDASHTGATGVRNEGGTIGSIINTGVISAPFAVINSGSGSAITSIRNNGTMGQISNDGGTIGTIVNTGQINGAIGISNGFGVISVINNSGTINGGIVNISNLTSSPYQIATIGNLINSGLIADNVAVFNNGVISAINNSGTIAGTINTSSSLTITGGTGATFGTLTGYNNGNISTIGLITSSDSATNINFASGNILLNDNIVVFNSVGGSQTVNNSGATLKVNQNISITGNYQQGANASLVIGVADNASAHGSIIGDSGYGRLVVIGDATVASGSSIVLQKNGSYTFAANQRFIVITATGTGTYNEGTLNYSISGVTGATFLGTNESNRLVVKIVDLPTAPVSGGLSTTPNASSALAGLSRYAGINNASLLNLYNASLAIGSTSAANKTGEQLAPTQNQNAASAGSTATFGGISVVTSHMDGVRIAQAEGGSGVATGENTGTWTGWTQVFGGDAHQGVIDNVSGYKASYSGLVLGADRSFGDAWRAGAAVTHSQTSVSGADNLTGSGSHVDAYGLIAYAGYTAQPWYLNLSASAVRNSYSSTRVVSLTGDAAQGSYNGWQYVAKAEAGYPLALQGLTVTPLASLSLSRLNVNGYTETGSGAALKVQGSSQNAVRSGLGVRLEKNLQTSAGALTPFAQLLWSHQYNDSRMSTTASFAADSTGVTSFTTQGAAPMKNVAELALGVNLLKSDDLTLSARYDLQAARHYDAQTFSVRLQKKF